MKAKRDDGKMLSRPYIFLKGKFQIQKAKIVEGREQRTPRKFKHKPGAEPPPPKRNHTPKTRTYEPNSFSATLDLD